MADTVRAVITKEGKLLVVTAHEAGCYWLPGGTVETGEDNIVALRRELKEELSIDLNSHELYKEYKSSGRSIAVFTVEYSGDLVVGSEITDYTWITKQPKIILGDNFKATIFADLLADGTVS